LSHFGIYLASKFPKNGDNTAVVLKNAEFHVRFKAVEKGSSKFINGTKSLRKDDGGGKLRFSFTVIC
jgi:hypothetical protein